MKYFSSQVMSGNPIVTGAVTLEFTDAAGTTTVIHGPVTLSDQLLFSALPAGRYGPVAVSEVVDGHVGFSFVAASKERVDVKKDGNVIPLTVLSDPASSGTSSIDTSASIVKAYIAGVATGLAAAQ